MWLQGALKISAVGLAQARPNNMVCNVAACSMHAGCIHDDNVGLLLGYLKWAIESINTFDTKLMSLFQ